MKKMRRGRLRRSAALHFLDVVARANADIDND
ncbi:hypothetical protein R52603_01001 [Paraburkholderia saeva]|uniref:Uncharacterized protein n=1 Tax=Paraburkholderia saeva TaxID=2777537 RepID=A0A9N8S1I1_9BURK|nr:hypothetical protein R52603_01001 [Paraburkholderia saeva]CAG4894857.1 hypothetical protein R70241_01888 [Paraburkholderia saeva]CAG4918430.1 hypothetical protein LMG31841_04785 [Paraburkholderia saeva]